MIALRPNGNGNWHTFIDRNLRLAGKVSTKDESKVIDTERGVAIIPSVAVHFSSTISATPVYDVYQLNAIVAESNQDQDPKKYLDTLLGFGDSPITSYDLYAFDSTIPRIFGDFIMAGGLSEISHAYFATKSFLNCQNKTVVLALFDPNDLEIQSNILAKLIAKLSPRLQNEGIQTKLISFESRIAANPLDENSKKYASIPEQAYGGCINEACNDTHYGRVVKGKAGIVGYSSIGFSVFSRGSARETASIQEVKETYDYISTSINDLLNN